MADIDALVAALTLEEKAALLAGADFWSTVGVERLGIPAIRVTDGPNGARGASIPGEDGPPSICIPCGSAMGATWDPALAEAIGAVVGRDALVRVAGRRRHVRAAHRPVVGGHRRHLHGRGHRRLSGGG